MKKLFNTLLLLLLLVLPMNSIAQRKFIHPGLTYTQADLDRMKAMVHARQEPFYSTYQAMLRDGFSQIGNGDYADITQIKEGKFNGTIGADGRRAHDLALLYHITGNKAYADDAVKRINRYNNLTNASSRGTAPLDNGKIYMLIEAAELLRDYEGWEAEDQAAFKKMLVYPFYSTTKTAESHKNLNDDLNDVSFYWNIYQFDPGRFGNQGLFAARGLLAMGVYLDNDTIYDRAYRYLAGLPARLDDYPYKPGPPTQGTKIKESEYSIDYNVSWPSTFSRDNQYHSDEVLQYYIFQNGQCQESSRDQPHTMGGLGNYTAIAEIAWNQGDDIYGWLDNRILLGIEYSTRYNLSAVQTYPDQQIAWEINGYSKNEKDCTFENGLFYQAVSRSKRWESVSINPQGRGSAVTGTGGWKTQALQHYKTRVGLPEKNTRWLQRSWDYMMKTHGLENWGAAPNWYYEWTGWGTLTKYRTEWMAGDPGSWNEKVRESFIPVAPCTIKAVDYDYFAGNGQGRTYNNIGTSKSTIYRTDGTVEISADGEDFVLTDMQANEWMNYTVVFPASEGNTTAALKSKYNIYVTYRASEDGAKLFASVDNGIKNGKELQMTTAWTERCLGTFEVECGAGVIRIYVKGKDNVLQLKSIRVEPLELNELVTINLTEKAKSVKVYDASNNDVSNSYQNSIIFATDKIFDVPINLGHQKFLVYDFGEEGLDISSITFYNDGKIMDTREQAFVLGSTEGGTYNSAWNNSAKKDIMRTNNTIQGNCPIIDNSWITEGGAIGSYKVGPLGKYRYFGVYNWSAACNISEVEVQSIQNTKYSEPDMEPSAEWDDEDTSIEINKKNNTPSLAINGNQVTAGGAQWIKVYSLTGALQTVVNGNSVILPSGLYILKTIVDDSLQSYKVLIQAE